MFIYSPSMINIDQPFWLSMFICRSFCFTDGYWVKLSEFDIFPLHFLHQFEIEICFCFKSTSNRKEQEVMCITNFSTDTVDTDHPQFCFWVSHIS